jgi:hypothetical protein
MMSLSTKLQLTSQGGELSYLYNKWVMIPRRGAHGLFKEGATSVVNGLPSVGEWAATSPHTTNKCQRVNKRGGCATSWECGLPPQGCATSPRGAHLSFPMCQYLKDINSNQMPINWICLL